MEKVIIGVNYLLYEVYNRKNQLGRQELQLQKLIIIIYFWLCQWTQQCVCQQTHSVPSVISGYSHTVAAVMDSLSKKNQKNKPFLI